MDATATATMQAWLDDPAIAEADKAEVRELRTRGDDKELTDRFYQDLAFGTGGLRGIIGAGTNRMNVYTVGAAAQGLAAYVARQGEAAKRAGVAIAYDCRRMSDVFAERVAAVMAGNDISAYLFDALRPTPELSFAIRHLGCTAGVVITASHNPPAYNGFKAYWTDGGQITPPHDAAIIDEVRRVGGFGNVRVMDPEEARAKGLIKMIGREVDEAFLDLVAESCLNPEACRRQGADLKIVYTSLHGTGGTLIPEALRRRGFQQIIEVPQQSKPDGDFPTVKSPNPEEAAALDMAIELARREGADLVIGTDPDADRVGIAVRRPDGEYELISGNRIGALLTHYICEQLVKNSSQESCTTGESSGIGESCGTGVSPVSFPGPGAHATRRHRRDARATRGQGTGSKGDRLPPNAVMITTIVSGDLMKDIARSFGAEVVETLTGFKWIGRELHRYDEEGTPQRPSKTFIFGAEESYGYMPRAFTRDKDAVTSTAFIAEVAAVAAADGKGLHELLHDLFKKYGYYQEGARNILMRGKEGAAQIKAMMDALRTDPPKTIGGVPLAACADMLTGEKRDLRTGKVLGQYDLPSSNVLMFTREDGTKVIARPSGTEPKIKFYILVKEPGDDLAKTERAASAKIESIVADLVKRAEAFSR